MDQKVHFLSGLPRSGSTLLCAILRQNPRFAAAVTSPVASLWGAITPKMSGGSEFHSFFDDERRRNLYRSVFEGYYANVPGKDVIVDTNRTWTGRAPLISQVFPHAKIICCVREVAWIIDSVESMLRRNALQTSRVFKFQPGASIYARVETLMNSDEGLIGLPWSNLREMWFSENASRMIVVNYETLTREPEQTVRRLYEALKEPHFKHDFNAVIYDEPDYDADLGMPGLHKVREQVAFVERQSCIPPDIFAKYAETNFWLKPELNRRGATVL